MNKYTIVTLMITFLAFTGINLAYAHTDLTSSSPESDEHLQSPPDHLKLTFGDPVRLMRVNLTDGAGDRVRLDFRPGREADTNYRIDLPTLDDGHFEVEWRAVADDGHTMTGGFSFHVGESDDRHEAREKSQSDHQGHH